MSKKYQFLLGFAILLGSLFLLNNLGFFDNFKDNQVSPDKYESEPVLSAENRKKHDAELVQKIAGIAVSGYEIEKKEVEAGQSISDILLPYGINYGIIHHLATNFKDTFDLRQIRTGKPYTLFTRAGDSANIACYMVYHPDPVNHVVIDLNDSTRIYKVREKVTKVEKEVSGTIESSLYQSMVDQGVSPLLVIELSKVYAWTIDFFRIQPGDSYKIIYEEKFIQDTISVGLGQILAVDFNHEGRDFYAFYFENEKYRDYFDEQGRSLRKAFLKAPLDFFRISSRYNPRRFHPVLKRVKPHLGTDYAAPSGTPIRSTADGEVIAAAYTRGNGNYVKVRHNSTYTTQYLHMSKFAKGIKVGKRVRQGDVIGYVGSTGLATGPHVCYRFWVNGQQVDPLKQDLPEAEPIEESYQESFHAAMQPLKKRLEKMSIPEKTKQEEQVATL